MSFLKYTLMKHLLILVLLISVQLEVSSQKAYAPLNAEWKYEGHSLDCTGEHQRYTVEMEQIIDGKDCSVIYGYLWNREDMVWVFKDSLVVWENDNKVFFLENDSFYLLYDFDAEPGDTINSFDPINKPLFSYTSSSVGQTIPNLAPYYVDSVGSIDIEGIIRKTYHTTAIETESYDCVDKGMIIENIGSTSMGITGYACFSVTVGCFGRIVCYKNADIYYESGFLSCEFFTNTRTVVEVTGIDIFPNPVDDILHITNESALRIEQIEIVDMAGQLLLSSQRTDQVNVQALPPGVYVLKLLAEGKKIVTRRMVKR